MAHNGILTRHGRKSDGKTFQSNKTITTTANVATTTTVEDILPKRSSNAPIIRQEKTQTLQSTPSDATQSILSDGSDNNASNSSDNSQVRNSNKNQVSINSTTKEQASPENLEIYSTGKTDADQRNKSKVTGLPIEDKVIDPERKLREQSELVNNMMKMIESTKKKEVEEAVQEKMPPVKSLLDCADAEQVSTLSTGELNLKKMIFKF
eukprot:jgi/Psemu1/24705/gm1.24705_g